ncbi:MAG: NYN domain-containing protein [Elusimicrobia bacterium]|nr:NYN domain-containing protein [Elusimicrobiota bacterium]
METPKLERLLEEKAKELKEKNIKLDQLEHELAHLAKENERLQKENLKCRELADTAKKMSDEAIGQREGLEAEIRRLTSELEKVRAQIERCRRMKQAGLFVDFENIRLCLKNRMKKDPDLGRVLKEIEALACPPDSEDRFLVFKRAYVVADKNLQALLEQAGYEVLEKRPDKKSSGEFTCNWDVGIALDIVEAAPRLDAVAVASGDGDFIDLAQALAEKFKGRIAVEFIGIKGLTNNAIQQAAVDGRIQLLYINA